MPVSIAPPKRKVPTEADIEAVINKGLKPADEQPDHEEEKPAHVNTRLTRGILRQIDALRASRPRKPGSPKLGISTHDWIVEAVLEKLDRDSAPK
jgi:3-hydroxyacyl-CoA dehydrogenase